jgi:ribosomal peptide maturation radical SAM protein 1
MVANGLLTIGGNQDPSVFLFATPWMKGTWPSLAIGSLKSFLRVGDIEARCCHFHLEAAATIGWSRYDALAETWGAGEALFGALLDPSDSERLVSVAAELLCESNQSAAAQWAEKSACDDLRALVDMWLERERPERYPLVGGSVGAMQLCGTLYLMKRVRERGHAGRRILGGSGLVGSVGCEVLKRCPYIDAVIDGEGEHALLEIAHRVLNGSRTLGGVARVLSRDTSDNDAGCRASSLDLSTAPPADLEEFYSTAARLGVPKTALTLSFEYSRGCEWEHRSKGKLRGCTFCGLYRNSPDHRRKPVERVLREIEYAVQRYQVLNLAFVDAYLPPDYRDELLDGLIRSPADVSFFTEMRCDLTKGTAERLAARADRIQLGVESFSSAILRRIGKGIGAAQSVYSIRLCQEYGIPAQYNLMTRIPAVPVSEINDLHDLLPTLFGLVPPTITEFYLDRNSLIFANPEAFGVASNTLDAELPGWLARSLGDSRISQVVPFRSADPEADAAWQRVKAQVGRWQERWRTALSSGLASPLIWRDGSGWASVTDAREEVAHIYLLEGILYEVFLACNDVTREKTLGEVLPSYSPAMISEALRQLASRRLVLRDGPRWVALPVRAGVSVSARRERVSLNSRMEDKESCEPTRTGQSMTTGLPAILP